MREAPLMNTSEQTGCWPEEPSFYDRDLPPLRVLAAASEFFVNRILSSRTRHDSLHATFCKKVVPKRSTLYIKNLKTLINRYKQI